MHALAVTHLRQQYATTCDVAQRTLQLVSTNRPKLELAQDIRGRMRCSQISRPYGANSDQVVKLYVFYESVAADTAQSLCQRLRDTAGPTDEVRFY